MPKQNNKSKNVQTGPRVFRGIRDPLVGNAAAASPTVYGMNTNGSGVFVGVVNLSPLGVAGTQIVVPTPNTAGSVIVPSVVPFTNPYLPWLFNQSRGFERYRVTRAVAIWVSNVGSTVTGRVMLDSSTDFSDAISATGISTSTGGKVFDLAGGASKEMRFQMDVDSSWKKVSSNCTTFQAGTGVSVPTNTINDLSFTTLFVTISGGPASTDCGSMFVEYDIEFREPIAFGANI